ncbi:hypothetical protein D3C71_2079130 [compost metagenome]
MRLTNGINVTALQRLNIPQHILLRNRTSAAAVKLMAIDTFENNTFPIDAHQLVLHFKSTEPCLLDDRFNNISTLIVNRDTRTI